MKTILTFSLFTLIFLFACQQTSTTDSATDSAIDSAIELSKDQSNTNHDSLISKKYKNRNVYQILDSLNLKLPELGKPVANYVHVVRTGNLIFTSGKGPKDSHGETIKGKLGKDLNIEEGYQAAQSVALLQLAAIHQEIGDLNKIKRVLKVLGMVNATPDFKDHSKVINGFSNRMTEILGDKGKHARSAVGMASLPGGMACEIEMIVKIE